MSNVPRPARPIASLATYPVMGLVMCLATGMFACASAGPEATPRKAAPVATETGPELPSPERWRQHLRDEILPFWTHADALGQPHGNFPTFRCIDGSAYRADAPCPELGEAPPWIRDQLGVEYTRMKSRQTFVYGVGYHVTGDPALLAHARAGVEYLRKHAYEADSGSAVSLWRHDGGAADPGPGARTAQDLAYAQLGLAFYYYLTRDPEVLRDLVRLDEHLFTMSGPRYRRYREVLARSYDCWFERFVDREHGEVWMFLAEDGSLPFKPAKAFQWKNGYHSAEHALVSMIASAALSDQPIALYYAFRDTPPRDRIQPYYFRGTITDEQAVDLPGMPGLAGRRVTFADIRP